MRVERVLIPKERLAVAIGSEGEVRKRIEEETKVKLDYDSETGAVTIKGSDQNPLGALTARDVIKAIGRGFCPEKAYRLFDEDSYLEIIDITDYTGDSDSAKSRMKGRLIGRKGKTRRLIEEYTGAYVSIYGKTVAFIDSPDRIKIVEEAIHMLLSGAPHSAVYKFLEEKKKEAEKPLDLWK